MVAFALARKHYGKSLSQSDCFLAFGAMTYNAVPEQSMAWVAMFADRSFSEHKKIVDICLVWDST